MRNGWEQKKLGEVCSLVNRGVAPKYVEAGGISVLNQKCVRDHRIFFELGRRHDVGAKKVAPERFIRVGDVLVNSTGVGTLGRVAQVRVEPSEPTTVDTHVTIVRPEPERFYPAFFGYMLILIEGEIAKSGAGASGQTELARSTLQNKFRASFPTSLAEQQRIVAILDESFAGLATATVNAEKNLKNSRQLFDSYLNSIFARGNGSWIETSLGEACEMYQPKTISARDLVKNGKYPVYGANGVIGRYNEFNHEEAQLLITCRGATCGAVNVSEPKSWITGNAMVVRPRKNDIDLKFLEFAFRGGVDLSRAITGAAQPQITRGSLSPIRFTHPKSVDEQRRLSVVFSKLHIASRNLGDVYLTKLKSLAVLRQSILHRAFADELASSPAAQEAAE